MAAAASVRVATFNVRHARPPRGWARVERLVAQCRTLGADVLGFQELDHRMPRSYFRHQAGALARGLDMTYVWTPTRRLLFGKTGNAILSRGALSETRVIHLPHRRGHHPRRATTSRTSTPLGLLTVVNTHLQNDDREAARQLYVLLDELHGVEGPLVLLGDLNLPRPDVTPVLADAGFTLAAELPTSTAASPTRQIDHIAARGLRVVATRVGTRGVSDHLPLVAQLAATA